MADAIGDTLPWPRDAGRREQSPSAETSAETTSGGSESVRWTVVADYLNPGEAAIIKGRLESEQIPAVIQQEAVGSVLGLTVGPLGSAKVLVPEPLAEQALALLAETYEVSDEGDEAFEAFDEDSE
jgi:hypothetical protein